jgi:hypothetical protein
MHCMLISMRGTFASAEAMLSRQPKNTVYQQARD